MRFFLVLATVTLFQSAVALAQCHLPYKLDNGQVPDADQLMANYNAVVNCIAALLPAGGEHSIQTKGAGGVFTAVGPLTNGQVVVGVNGSPPVASEIQSGTGIVVDRGAGMISIAAQPLPGDGQGLYHQVMSPTPTSVGTGLVGWLNQGSATISDTPVGISVTAPSVASGENIVGRLMSAPTPPYKITALIASTRNSSAYAASGLGWYNGSNRLHLIALSPRGGSAQYVGVNRFNSPTSFSSSDFDGTMNGFAQPLWLQIADDGTNISFAFSQDGANFRTAFTTTKSSGWLGASGYSNVVMTTNPQVSQTTTTILSWQQQ
jgi:hypothetical protein